MTRGAVDAESRLPPRAALIKSRLSLRRRIVPETSLRVMNINFPIRENELDFETGAGSSSL